MGTHAAKPDAAKLRQYVLVPQVCDVPLAALPTHAIHASAREHTEDAPELHALAFAGVAVAVAGAGGMAREAAGVDVARRKLERVALRLGDGVAAAALGVDEALLLEEGAAALGELTTGLEE